MTPQEYKALKQQLRTQLLPLVKGQKLGLMVKCVNYPDDDPIDGYYAGGVTYRKLTKKELFSVLVEQLAHYPGEKPLAEYTLQDMISVYEEASESQFGHIKVMTIKQVKKERAEAEYQRIEAAAQAFCGSCGEKLGSVKFIRQLERAIQRVRDQREQWNSGECRMEEWAAHMYAGGGSETYFSDLNFENGRYHERLASLQDVWDYLERKFPIMMLRYREHKAKRKQ